MIPRTFSWIALMLISSPIWAFTCLGIFHPMGDPQTSPNGILRSLDFLASYWMRNAIPVPPPLLVVGLLISIPLWWKYRLPSALAGSILGTCLLGFWGLIMIVPLLIHVN